MIQPLNKVNQILPTREIPLRFISKAKRFNVSEDAFADSSKAANIPTTATQFVFTPTFVNTGADLVFFDTGLNPVEITAVIGAAGYTPGQVGIAVLTHMHGDHIGGFSRDAGVSCPNATYVTGAVEFNH